MCFRRGEQIRFKPLKLGGSYFGAYGLRPLPVPEVNSGTFTPGFGAPTPKRLRG